MQNATAKPNKQVAWSYSALTQFETCPKQYAHIKVLRDVKEKQNEAGAYGQEVHKALELRVKNGKQLPLGMRHYEPLAKTLESAKGTVMTEQKLAINALYQPTGWFDSDVYCRAVLDIAIVNGEKAFIGDYKTGRMSDDFTQLKLATALYMQHDPDIKEATVAFFWLKERDAKGAPKRTMDKLTREQLPEIWNEFIPRVRKMETAIAESNFPPRQNGLCKRFCPVKQCPYNGGG